MTQIPAEVSVDDEQRVKDELQRAGIEPSKAQHFYGTYLSQVLHKDEHVQSAIFGRHREREGIFGYQEGMLVATDERILFIDHDPGYTTMDELFYNSVSGVNVSSTLFNASVTLYTRVRNYLLSFVTETSARNFSDYIERRLTGDSKKA